MPAKFVRFMELGPSASGKTEVWAVTTAPNPSVTALGEVKWHGPWRCYAFFPFQDTLYERQCLRDIADFCEEKTAAHRQRRADATRS